MPKKNKREDEKKSGSVRGQLLQAGKNGNISKRELMQIGGSTGKSSAQIIGQLDKLNAKKELSIGLGNAAVKGLMKSPFPSLGFGEGKLGSAVGDYWKATNAPLGGTDKSGSYSNWSGYQEVTPGMKQSRAGLMPLQGGAYQLDAQGKYSPKIANKSFMANYANKMSSAATGKDTATGAGNMGAGTASTEGITTADTTVDTTVDSQVALPGISTALANWAQGFRRKASSRQQAGRKAQGLASAKIAPVTNTLGY